MNSIDNARAAKRALRRRIGQLRRQLDRRLDAARRDTRRLVSLEEWLRNRPWAAALAALGLGAAAAKGLHGAAEPERDGGSFSPKQLGQVAAALWQWIGRWREAWAAAVDSIRAAAPQDEANAASDDKTACAAPPEKSDDDERPSAAAGNDCIDAAADSPRDEGDRHVAE